MKKTAGFTLIELLVVIFIIGILATMVIINVADSRKTARDTQRLANMRTIQTALEQFNQKYAFYPYYKTSTDKFPNELTNTVDTWNGWAGNCTDANYGDNTGTGAWIPGLVTEFLPVLPSDPSPTDTNCYRYKSDGQDYQVLARLETCYNNDCTDSHNPASIQGMARQMDHATIPAVGYWTRTGGSW